MGQQGLATVDRRPGGCSTCWYPEPRLGAAGRAAGAHHRRRRARGRAARRARGRGRSPCIDDLDAPPADAADAYLRLHLLSHRLVAAARRSTSTGIFGVLPNVAWTSHGPVDPAALPAVRLRVRARPASRSGRPRRRQVPAHDRLRRAVAACAIADADRVRLGAHLAEGTTVMHEGFVNYNAGTLGASMVEGRISRRRRGRRRLGHRRRRVDHGHAVGRRHRR